MIFNNLTYCKNCIALLAKELFSVSQFLTKVFK